MKKHRGLFLALGLLGLLGLMSQTAHAGTLTMVISTSGGSITITPTGPYVLTGASNESFTVNTDKINGILKTDGVNLAFSSLSANTQGSTPGVYYPTSGTLTEGGTLGYANNSGTINSLTVSTSISGYSAPTGTGTLNSTSTALFTNTAAGNTQMWSTSYQTTTETSHTFTSTGQASQSLNSPTYMNKVGTIAQNYGLDNSSTITLSKGTDVFGVSTVLTAAVPEPTSIVLMLTSMPLPLVVMGLIRRRRRAMA